MLYGMDALQLQQVFMKIDANSDGSISWDEFSGYILAQGNTLDANTKKQAPVPAIVNPA